MHNFIDSLSDHAEIMNAHGHTSSYHFFYHRTKRYNVTIAYRRTESNSVIYGAAFCRPGDQFSKKLGRNIACGRMDTYNNCIENPGSARWEVHESILDQLTYGVVDPYVPDNFRP